MSLNRSPERLALQAIKYQQLDGWSPAVMTDFIRND